MAEAKLRVFVAGVPRARRKSRQEQRRKEIARINYQQLWEVRAKLPRLPRTRDCFYAAYILTRSVSV